MAAYRPLRTVVLAACLSLLASAAHAGSEPFCRQYTEDAVADQRRNVEMGCGFAGAAWNASPAGHQGWCRSAREDSANKQRIGRRNALARCQRCNGYANGALAAIRKVGNQCTGGGISGARWHPDRVGHFKWCMTAKPEHVNREERFRNYDAEKCVRCFQYTELAVQANQKNRHQKCGFTGSQWSDDRLHHFRWCWNLKANPVAEPAGETRRREAALRSCPDAAKRKDCENYAARAISQYNAARQIANCGQRGPMWHNNRQNHFGWCVSKPSAEVAAHDRARDEALAKCRGATHQPGSKPGGEQCLISVTARNKSCINVDGSPMTSRPANSLSATGCGDSEDKAKIRAKASFASHQCVTDGDTPQRGCCTVALTVTRGCLCGAGTLSVRPGFRRRN